MILMRRFEPLCPRCGDDLIPMLVTESAPLDSRNSHAPPRFTASIWGVFGDGRQRRNFIHVSDVATAVLAALETPLPTGLTPLNIGTPWVTTVGQMATELSHIFSGPAPILTGAYRLGDVRHLRPTVRQPSGFSAGVPRSIWLPASPTCRWITG
jgi:dTDP-L-rhamnose 4-epimerase